MRLGPESGERVADYLARLPAELPAAGRRGVRAGAVRRRADAGGGARRGRTGRRSRPTAVLRVPLPRVQTALRFERAGAGHAGLGRAGQRARPGAAGRGGRRRRARPAGAAAVAAAEAAALADPACRCVLALLVRADRAGLEALAARPEVRAVHAAPAGVAAAELALAPLLPGQLDRVVPLPDDGPVGAAGTVAPAPPR